MSVILCGDTSVLIEQAGAKLQIRFANRLVMEEAEPLALEKDAAVQTLVRRKGEDFYGGGTQNGRFLHTGRKLQIVNESSWMDGGVASPNPFYFTTAGYGALRNTFSEGAYDFGAENAGNVVTTHKEGRFSVYYFLSAAKDRRRKVQEI